MIEAGTRSGSPGWCAAWWTASSVGSACAADGAPDRLIVGDTVDFWRVEAIERPTLLRLRAEMKLPGQAWLELAIDPSDPEHPVLHQRALFVPRGLAGHAYWWAISPFHNIVFGSMIANLARAATMAGRQPPR